MKLKSFTLNIALVLTGIIFIYGTGDKKIPSDKIQVKANVWETKEHGAGDFFPNLTLDGDLSGSSSWRGEKVDDVKPSIQYDLGSFFKISHINLAFFKGDQRSYVIEILISEDEQNWISIFNGATSGKTSGFEKYEIGKKARYVKVVGNGNTNEAFPNWTNITEVEVYKK